MRATADRVTERAMSSLGNNIEERGDKNHSSKSEIGRTATAVYDTICHHLDSTDPILCWILVRVIWLSCFGPDSKYITTIHKSLPSLHFGVIVSERIGHTNLPV